jgi:hypothetical protein
MPTPPDIFNAPHVNLHLGGVAELPANVVPMFREKLCYCHPCVNFLFKLQDDGMIICDKCGLEVGYWQLK